MNGSVFQPLLPQREAVFSGYNCGCQRQKISTCGELSRLSLMLCRHQETHSKGAWPGSLLGRQRSAAKLYPDRKAGRQTACAVVSEQQLIRTKKGVKCSEVMLGINFFRAISRLYLFVFFERLGHEPKMYIETICYKTHLPFWLSCH